MDSSLDLRNLRLETVLDEIVGFAIAITGADFGNVQLVDAATGRLKIRAQRGFPQWWLDYWDTVGAGQGSCHAASRCTSRLFVEDVERSEIFAGTPGLEVQLRVGVRACQSTPIMSRSGVLLGVFSTHWKTTCRPDERTMLLLDLLARQAAHIVELSQAEAVLEQTNAMLRSSEERYRSLVEQVVDGIFLADSQGRYIDVNGAGAEMLGYSPEEICRMSIIDVIHPDEIARMPDQMSQLSSGTIVTNEWLFRRKDDSLFTGEVVGRQLPDGRLLGILRDVSARKQGESALRAAKIEADRANQAKSRFLAAVSHDLRQPVSALALYVGSLAGKLPDADRELVSNMKQCVGGLTDMLSDLLDLSKLEAGVVQPNIADVSIDEIFERVAAALGPRARNKGLALRCRIGGYYGRTDPVLLLRIVSNFASNAIRYTERGGLLLACRRKRGKLWIEIWDTGIGIPEGKTAEIFEEFRQLGNFERNREKGAGIGLSIVAKEAALLGLEVRVASRLGRGSMFAVEVPPGRRIARAEPVRLTPAPLKIALVEDNPAVAKALSYVLSTLGHTVFYGSSRDELLAELDGVAPDILVSDYRLAGNEDGYGVIAALRGRFGAGLPAMLITGDTDSAIIREMAARGVHVQHKPLDMERFCAALAQLTGKTR